MTPNASRQLLEAARQVQVGSANGKSLGKQRLLSALATGTITATAAAAEASYAGAALGAAASSTGAATGSLVGLATSAVVVGALTGALAMGISSTLKSPRPTQESKPNIALVAHQPKAIPSTPLAVVESITEPQSEASAATTATAAPSHTVKSERPSIEEETRLLQRAQGAMNRRLYADALQILDEYDRRFSVARLGEEAMALRVLVHCQTGHLVDARRWASLLTERHANSALLGRLRASCPQAFIASKRTIVEQSE